jgi:hypothetical protein
MDLTAFFQALTSIFPFLPKVYNAVIIDFSDILLVFFWFVAAAISFYFSLNNSRIWTSISIGFFLLFWSQSYQLNPWNETFTMMIAVHYMIGTVAILIISHGIQEYFVFTRTLEITGSKQTIYIATALIIALTILVISLNPKPSLYVLRNYRIMNSVVWFYLCIINIYTVFKIYKEMKDSPIANGILSFGAVFVFALIWKGSALYLMMYQWDKPWQNIIEFDEISTDIALHTGKVEFAQTLNKTFNFLTSFSVAGTFAYLFKLLR